MMQSQSSLLQRLAAMDIRILAMPVAALIILYKIALSPLLNTDAFYYLSVASFFQEQGLLATLNEYGWHGYSAVIGLLDFAVPGDMVYAAYLFNMLMCLLLVWSFISLVLEYRDTPTIRVFAAISILAWPSLIEITDYVVRDFGFWAFSLLALCHMIRFHKTGHPLCAVAWVLAMLGAIFFRLEGLLLLALTPLSLLWRTDLPLATRLRHFSMLLLILGSLALLVLLASISAGLNLAELMRVSYQNYLPRLLDYTSLIASDAARLNEVLFFDDYAPGRTWHGLLLLIVSYLYTLGYCIAEVLSIILLIPLLYGLRIKAYHLEQACLRPLLVVFIAACLYLFMFLSTQHFLTWRYCTFAALLLLSLLPLCLEQLYLHCRNSGKIRRFHYVFGFMLLYYLIESLLSFGASKAYILEAGHWLQDNNDGRPLMTNNLDISYMNGQLENILTISLDPADYLDENPGNGYLAVEIKAREPELLEAFSQQPGLELVTHFANPRNDQVLIYRASRADDAIDGNSQ